MSAVADVFISHATPDRGVAEAARERLESRGLRCWIAPRDVPAGASYPEAIADAIASCGVFLVVLSNAANASEQVAREAERAVSARKRVVTFRIEEVEPNRTLQYFLSTTQWLNALPAPTRQHYDSLVLTIGNITSPPPPKKEPPALEQWMRKVREAVHPSPKPLPQFAPSVLFGTARHDEPAAYVPQSIRYGEHKRSDLSRRGEVHTYYFEARAGDVIVATIDDRGTYGGQPIEWQPRIALTDEQANVLAESCEACRTAIGPHTIPSSGIFSIVVSHNDDARGYYRRGTGAYALFLQCVNAAVDARPLVDGDDRVVDLASGGDVHTFALPASEGQRIAVTIGVAGKPFIYPALDVYDPDGAIVDRTYSYSAVRVPDPASMVFVAKKSGTYVALINSHFPNAHGTYRVRCAIDAGEAAAAPVQPASLEIVDAEVDSHRYVTRCVHWSVRADDETFVEDFAAPLLAAGQQVVLVEEHDLYSLAEGYDGTRGHLPNRLLQRGDPKSYFTARIRGKDVVGYLCGVMPSPERLALFTRAGSVSLPIHRITSVAASRRHLIVEDIDGNAYDLDRDAWSRSANGCPAYFVHARWPGIKSGHGAMLALSRAGIRELGESVVFRRVKRARD